MRNLLVVLALCGIAYGQGAPPAYKEVPLSASDKAAVEEALGCLTDLGDAGGKSKEAAAKAAAALSAALRDKRVTKGENMGRAGGLTGPDGKGKASTALNELLFAPGKDPGNHCTPGFIDLLEGLLHEGVHHGQNLILPNPLPDVPPGIQLFQKELFRMANECEAYEAEVNLKNELNDVLGDLLLGKKNTPAWATECFGACTPAQLISMQEKLIERRRTVLGYISALSVYLKDCKPPDKFDKETVLAIADALLKDKRVGVILDVAGVAKTIKGLSDYIKDKDVAGELTGLRVRHQIAGGADGSADLVWKSNPPVFRLNNEDLDTGVAFPQDVEFLTDSSDRTWILVAGNETQASGGIIRAIRLEADDEGVHIADSLTVADPDNLLGYVTAIARRSDGSCFVMDRPSMAIYRLADNNGDAIPDTLGALAAQPPAGLLEPHVTLDSSGDLLISRQRTIVTPAGNEEYLVLQDTDGDGFFETAAVTTPSASPFRTPAMLGEPVAGAQTMGVSGTHGHVVLVLAGPQGQEQIIGQGSVPAFPDDQVIVQLSRAVQQGESVRVSDPQNNLDSSSHPVLPRRPEIYRLVSPFGLPKVEVEFTIHGNGLELVSTVRVGGKPADILSQGPDSLTLRVSGLKDEASWGIEFEMQGGATIVSPVRLFSGE